MTRSEFKALRIEQYNAQQFVRCQNHEHRRANRYHFGKYGRHRCTVCLAAAFKLPLARQALLCPQRKRRHAQMKRDSAKPRLATAPIQRRPCDNLRLAEHAGETMQRRRAETA